jgi:hypothetical protein
MNVFRRLLDRLTKAGGRKGSAMADNNQATPPADVAALQKTVTDLAAVVTSLANSQAELVKNVDTVAQTLAKLPPATPAAKAGDAKPEALTADGVARIVAEQLSAATKTHESKAARDAYLADKLKDLPGAYRKQLGDDPTKWATEEQSIREQFKADLTKAGVKPADLGNASAEGGTPPAKTPVDRSKMDPMELLNSDNKTAA